VTKTLLLDLDDVQDAFTHVLQILKDRAYTDTGINITAATIIYPDFFPCDVGNRVRAAAYADDDDEQPSLILLEQGVAHLDLLTSGKHCMIPHPMDSLQCTNIDLALWVEFKKRNEDIKKELVAGQSWPALRRELARARGSLKECRQQKGEEGEQVEEWPLELDGWWSSEEKRRPVVLRREDVQTVDEVYVASLAGTLDQVQLCLQGTLHVPT
jgi:hypothetical protein